MESSEFQTGRRTMQRNIMERTPDIPFFQEIYKRGSLLKVPQLNVEHMRIMDAAFRYNRYAYLPGISQRLECMIILIPAS